jgi:hypothetical protein
MGILPKDTGVVDRQNVGGREGLSMQHLWRVTNQCPGAIYHRAELSVILMSAGQNPTGLADDFAVKFEVH